jgi:hypothetical protein
MFRDMFKALVGAISICAISSGAFLHAECSVGIIEVTGRVEQAPRNGRVKVQLIFPKDKIGESGDVTVENGRFRIRVPFLARTRTIYLNESIPLGKCGRKPKTIVVTLIDNEREYDRVSLEMAREFDAVGSGDYALRSGILLRGPPGANPVQ